VRLLVIRHGLAGNPEKWEAAGRDDRLRPLTPKGKKELRRAAPGLVRLVPTLDALATSPWVRAAQTAEIVAEEYDCEIETVEQLTSDHKPEDLMPWLEKQRQRESVGVVGHEPHLSLLVGYLLTGKSSSLIQLKKGGACLLDMADHLAPGRGMLEWLLTDRELRRLG
jgi:phosphohistidine phosphatase